MDKLQKAKTDYLKLDSEIADLLQQSAAAHISSQSPEPTATTPPCPGQKRSLNKTPELPQSKKRRLITTPIRHHLGQSSQIPDVVVSYMHALYQLIRNVCMYVCMYVCM